MRTPASHKGARPSSDLGHDEVVIEAAALSAASIVEGSASAAPPPLPFGLKPAKPKQPKYQVVDLGPYDPDWADCQIVFDKDLPIEIEEIIAIAQDSDAPARERLEANYRFLELVLLAWNLTIPDPLTGDPVLLPQPQQGGVRHLKTSQVKAITAAFNKAFAPAPK